MAKKQSKSVKKRIKPKETGEMSLKRGRATVVVYQDVPSKPPPDKRIHARRALPLVPDGAEKQEERTARTPDSDRPARKDE